MGPLPGYVMHITDGILSTPTMIATNIGAATLVAGALPRIDCDRIPRVGVLAAVFFMASFIHVNLGPSSVHLLLNGFLGLLLGWASFPALAVALFLQWMLLGYGGITSLGANILVMGAPAMIAGILFSRPCRYAGNRSQATFWGAVAGGTSVVLTCCFFVALLHISSPASFSAAIKIILLAHVPIILIEAVVVGAAVGFIYRVRPDFLDLRRPAKAKTAGVAALFLLGLTVSAEAHTARCFASADGKKVVGHAWAGRGVRVKNAAYEVRSPDGALLHQGKTGEDGTFSFQPTTACDHHISVLAGEGHLARFTLKADELPGNQPVRETSALQTAGTHQSASTKPVPQPGGDGWLPLVSEAVRREMAPLRRDLAQLKSRSDFRDLMAGLGLIAGITGLAFYIVARKQRHP